MVHLRGMVDEGWYIVQVSKLWYDYIIIVRAGNAGIHSYEIQWVFNQNILKLQTLFKYTISKSESVKIYWLSEKCD